MDEKVRAALSELVDLHWEGKMGAGAVISWILNPIRLHPIS